ncbi:hypothetical protein T265_10991 [Opisthorchis viverrini]|uniref:Uncharacterized protein n=1 Tax=Opisthorchis viverrini TaxID=6198 RepID=A0A074Z0I6_OPIVI|nr:hypothetical protein T265_10991 [Opisthorchis viverrini]KER20458.1 hypothetical protein T265_10991 [Opisthorchis viverrini]
MKDFVCVTYVRFDVHTEVCSLVRNSATMREVTCSSASVSWCKNWELRTTGHINRSHSRIHRGHSSLRTSHIVSMNWKQVQVLPPLLVSITATSPIPVSLVSSSTKACLPDCDSNFKASPLTSREVKFSSSRMPFRT